MVISVFALLCATLKRTTTGLVSCYDVRREFPVSQKAANSWTAIVFH